ncbi:MAG TPA: AI-2E family transporter [Sphingobacteriaceae bacterium]
MDERQKSAETQETARFLYKLALTILLILVVLLVIVSFNILLMVLAACLIALYFHGVARLIKRKMRIRLQWSLLISVLSSLVLICLLFWLIGARIQSQATELSNKFPSMVDQGKQQLSQSTIGRKVLDQFSGASSKKLSSSIQKFFSSTFGILGDIYVILFLGVFFTANPKIYKEGLLALVPPKGKPKGDAVLNLIGHNLTSWLKGKLFSMSVVAILTGVGLSIIGIPMVFALAIIAGIFNFIPNFGPVIAMIPAVLVALSQGTNTVLLVVALYILIQVLESNLITPTVQKKLVSIPPAMIIIGQLVVGALTGYLGIILATPVVLILIVLTKELYVKKQG